MFYFAKVEQDNSISEVIVVSENDCGDLQFPESEPVGQSFIASLGKGGVWLQTSISGDFRKYCASVGSEYVQSADVFTTPRPFSSWVLDSDYEWQAPIPKPNEDGFWYWNDAEQNWQR